MYNQLCGHLHPILDQGHPGKGIKNCSPSASSIMCDGGPAIHKVYELALLFTVVLKDYTVAKGLRTEFSSKTMAPVKILRVEETPFL